MNQDQVKKHLLSLYDAPLEFSLIFSGKKSRKVNGLYKGDTREIIIHNKNFVDGDTVNENSLIYTSIHEYAHHIHACKRGGKLPSRAHTTEFWSIFHSLLETAEKKGLYSNTIDETSELSKITELIKIKYLKENGSLVKEFGECLNKAHQCCKDQGIRFEDYLDRILCIPRSAANFAIKVSQYDLNPQVGIENMRFLAGISNNQERDSAENALLSGKSPDTVKMQIREKKTKDEDETVLLEKEKMRITRTIDSLTKRLQEIDAKLEEAS